MISFDLAGHSLGAARAKISGAMFKGAGYAPASIITCGCPAPGMEELGNYIKDIPAVDFRNAGDPVWDVPTQPPFSHDHLPIITSPLQDGDAPLSFAYHKITRYQSGVAAVNSPDLPFIAVITALYDPQPGDFDIIHETHGVYWGIRKLGPNSRPLVVFRGSVTDEDWARDFIAVPIIYPGYSQIGLVHAGFALGMPQTVKAIIEVLVGWE